MLEINNLKVSTNGKLILNGISLSFSDKKVYAIMGPNGSGKTTLAYSIMGHPDYRVEEGKIFLNGEDITQLQPHERAKKGMFLGFQNPVEIQGLPVLSFLKATYTSVKNSNVSTYVFNKLLKSKLEEVGFGSELLNRNVNEGLSGGERKKLEVIQMYVLEPTHVILDEIDSGLDVDSLESVAKAIKSYHTKYSSSLILVTHYARILRYITPDKVIVISGGRAVAEGGPELADKIDREGYGWLQQVEGS
ncbi:MAG: Fe-S cluster assembly ATPase SufC [Conexivisphaerales archaeon]|nr:Fe-S cluster assembly ATPase SufC [Conexivisphaerales archaeon]